MTRPDFSPDFVLSVIRDEFDFDAATLTPLGGYADQNFLARDPSGEKRLIKIHDHIERRDVIAMQNDVIDHLSNAGLGLKFPKAFLTRKGAAIGEIFADDGQCHAIRMLSFVEGTLLADVENKKSDLLHEAGKVIGALDASLRDFHHCGASRPGLAWDLRNAAQTCRHIDLIAAARSRRLADYFLMKFETEIRAKLENLPLSVTHNDCHRFALIVDDSATPFIAGVIDFGDTVLSHPICHLAVAISDLTVGEPDFLQAAAKIVAGYHSAFPLSEDEIDILYHLIGLRLAMYLSMAAKAAIDEPDNPHPQMKRQDVEELIDTLVRINPIEVTNAFRAACGHAPRAQEAEDRLAELANARETYFSKSLYTHYQEPLLLTGGAFQYLYDAAGRTYTDLVNNVCQSGHCHPTIVRAVQQQIARLNTNSRYLYSAMSDFAETLLKTFPDELDTVFFVNSGSEANDLAMRMAKAFTGQSDAIVIDTAYHGNSSACTDISPHRIDQPGRPGLPEHVHKIVSPDRYRGPFGYEDLEAGQKYAEDVATTLERLVEGDRRVAAFFAESLIGTGGQIVLPPNYLASVYAHIRSSGGVCIADEVQVGFGRTGEHMWCFETQDVVPDIVTLGKPIANGFPMGAVITRREIADAFDNGVPYFNTFGGNPVACAAAKAVLQVLEAENLRANVMEVGAHLVERLRNLEEANAVIGDVRGLGLYIGVELVDDRETKAPATAIAKKIVERMKQKGFLTNTNGIHNNILKFKPPLSIGVDDIDLAVDALGECFVECGM